MTHVAINRIPVQPGNDELIRQSALAFFEERRSLLGGDLRSMQLVRSADGGEYALISVWASRAAHDRHEDSPDEQAALAALAPFVAGPPTQFAGEAVASLR